METVSGAYKDSAGDLKSVGEAYKPGQVVDIKPMSKLQKILAYERVIQSRIRNFIHKTPEKVEDTADKVKDVFKPPPGPSAPEIQLTPVQVSGFYKATKSNVLTFYVNTSWPSLSSTELVPIGPGWRATGMTGVVGNIIVTGTSDKPELVRAGTWKYGDNQAVKIGENNSESYLWSFDCQTDTEQDIQNVQGVIGLILYPPDSSSLTTNTVTGLLAGFYYVTQGRLVFYIQGSSAPLGFGPNWTVTGLPGLQSSNVVTVNYVPIAGKIAEMYEYDSYVTLKGDKVEYNTQNPVNCTITVKQPLNEARVIGANVMYSTETSNVTIEENRNIKLTGGAPLRELGEKMKHQSMFQDKYTEDKKDGFNSATTYALHAIGPQEEYTTGKDDSSWNTEWPQHTNFVCYQQYIPIQGTQFLGQTIMVELKPKELGDLLSNMYFTCQLPALTSTSNIYTNQVGRALIAQCDFMINDLVVETVYDDWFFIKDQVFLDSDEQVAMFSAVNNGSSTSLSPTSNVSICVPLEFFFCRRHSHITKGRERLRRPYFPLCALYNQRMYIRIQFQPWIWISNDRGVLNQEIINPALILEQIKLTESEKIYYKSTKLRYVINRVKKESVLAFNSFTTQLQLTASFPVQMLVWFIRNKKYETTTSTLYNDVRYEYGFTTKYVQTAVSLPFTSQTTYFVDPVDTCKIVLNNMDITSTFQGSLYYAFKQPMEHNLSVPAKNIYMYSFGLNPKEYNAGGYINFSKLDSQTTSLKIVLNQQYATQVTQGYNLYLFYYGYTILEFDGGYARLPFI